VVRAVVLVLLVFLILLFARALRIFLAKAIRAISARRPPPKEGEMARDPICGAWFDRRLAVTGRRGGVPVEVCSEGCRRRLEAS
jgi:hypothetical protein